MRKPPPNRSVYISCIRTVRLEALLPVSTNRTRLSHVRISDSAIHCSPTANFRSDPFLCSSNYNASKHLRVPLGFLFLFNHLSRDGTWCTAYGTVIVTVVEQLSVSAAEIAIAHSYRPPVAAHTPAQPRACLSVPSGCMAT